MTLAAAPVYAAAVITLFQPPPAWGIPSVSPFCTKVDQLEIGTCVAGAGLAGLVDLTGLGALTGLGSLRLIGNPALQSLAGLDGLVDGPTNLTVVDDPQLSSAKVAAFVAAHAVSIVCEDPPQVCCGILEWPAARPGGPFPGQ